MFTNHVVLRRSSVLNGEGPIQANIQILWIAARGRDRSPDSRRDNSKPEVCWPERGPDLHRIAWWHASRQPPRIRLTLEG